MDTAGEVKRARFVSLVMKMSFNSSSHNVFSELSRIHE